VGEIPATNANATASGTKASATVIPDKISFFILPPEDLSINCIPFNYIVFKLKSAKLNEF
jgi:hypothetical protein